MKTKLIRTHYLEDKEVKEHAAKSKQGLSRWLREASRSKYKKELKK